MDNQCSVADCAGGVIYAKWGLCRIHYKRAWKAGLLQPPTVPVPVVRSIEELARDNAAEVERKRALHAERIAGCPLEQWLARRRPINAGSSTGNNRAFCSCGCHVAKPLSGSARRRAA